MAGAGHTLPEAQLKELRAAFDMADKDGSGSIDAAELRQVLKALGQHPTPVELAELMQRMDANGNGVIEFSEFADAMAAQGADEELERGCQEVRDVFALFDTDGSGQLSADELQRALKLLGVRMSRSEVALLISEIDADGNGEVSCDELLQYVLNFDADAAEQGADLERGGSSKGGAT